MLAQSPKSERSDLRFEASKPVFVERDMAVDMTDLYTERSVNQFENWILQPMAKWSPQNLDPVILASFEPC